MFEKKKNKRLEASSIFSGNRRDSLDSRSPSNKEREQIFHGKISFKMKIKQKRNSVFKNSEKESMNPNKSPRSSFYKPARRRSIRRSIDLGREPENKIEEDEKKSKNLQRFDLNEND